MTELKHSPLPWTYETHELSTGFSSIVYDARGLGVPGMSHLNEADARLIVDSVNSHVALLSAAKYLYHVCKNGEDQGGELDIALAEMQAAIAAAEEPAS